MLAKYAGARTIAGVVSFVQSAEGRTVKSRTRLQYEKPSKIFLQQVYEGAQRQDGQDRFEFLLVSDGKTFTYDKPAGTHGRPRFVELVKQHDVEQTIQDMYTAERMTLVDRSPLLDVAIGRNQDLRELMGQWANMKVHSIAKLKDRDIEATAIIGSYREDSDSPVSGTFEAYITKDYELVRYVTKYTISRHLISTERIEKPVEVQTTWDSTLKVNAVLDHALFHVGN